MSITRSAQHNEIPHDPTSIHECFTILPNVRTLRPAHPSHLPFHVVPGVSNFRDIGGWKTQEPGTIVRRGILFRGSDTNRITAAGIDRLHELGIKADFDLRSEQQIKRTGGYRDIQGIQRIWTPIFADEQYSEEAAKQRYERYASENPADIAEAFVEILAAGAATFGTVLRHLLAIVPAQFLKDEQPPPGTFMHCTTGNNRTGVLVSVLLLFLGVPAETVVYEYTLSEQGLAPTRHINIERLLKKGAFQEHGTEETRRKCERMVGARPESMQHLINVVEEKWGGAPGYFANVVGLSQGEIDRLKKAMLVKEIYQ